MSERTTALCSFLILLAGCGSTTPVIETAALPPTVESRRPIITTEEPRQELPLVIIFDTYSYKILGNFSIEPRAEATPKPEAELQAQPETLPQDESRSLDQSGSRSQSESEGRSQGEPGEDPKAAKAEGDSKLENIEVIDAEETLSQSILSSMIPPIEMWIRPMREGIHNIFDQVKDSTYVFTTDEWISLILMGFALFLILLLLIHWAFRLANRISSPDENGDSEADTEADDAEADPAGNPAADAEAEPAADPTETSAAVTTATALVEPVVATPVVVPPAGATINLVIELRTPAATRSRLILPPGFNRG